MSGNGRGKPPSPIAHAVLKAAQQDQAEEALRRLIGQWDQYALAQRQLLPAIANALVTMVGEAVVVKGMQHDGETGYITGIGYRTADGVGHTLTINRPQTPPSGLIVPH